MTKGKQEEKSLFSGERRQMCPITRTITEGGIWALKWPGHWCPRHSIVYDWDLIGIIKNAMP